jgi:glycosyltransferase involved in cell wall biosynthesis
MGDPRPPDARAERVPLRVLAVVGDWPSATCAVSAFVKTQIESLTRVGVQTEVWNLGAHHKGSYKYWRGVLEVRRRARLGRFDLLHAHYGYSGWVARLQWHRPVVVSFMGGDVLGLRAPQGHVRRSSLPIVASNKLLARLADAVIVKSAHMARVLSPVPARVIANGVDTRLFHPADRTCARQHLGWADDRYYVLFPGLPSRPEKCWWLAQQAIHAAGFAVSRPIELIPLAGIPRDRVPVYMNACNALLMTSSSEGSPNAVKEALACDLPIVSVPVGDVEEVIAGVEGSVICARDPLVLGSALARVLRDGERCAGRVAIDHLGLDLDNVARRVRAVYDEVLAAKG